MLERSSWALFEAEIGRCRDAGRRVDFWWRDDDAFRMDPAVSRLAALAADSGVPLALAVVPQATESSAFEALNQMVTVIQHGVDHKNRAVAGEKKNEFPAIESPGTAVVRLCDGLRRLHASAPHRVIPVLAPPWNRLSPSLVPLLAEAGFRGLSTYGPRLAKSPAPGLTQINTHVDIIDWKGNRGFCGVESALAQAVRHLAAKRTGAADETEPTGWLSHHAVHDQASWAFLQRLFSSTQSSDVIRWRTAQSLFCEEDQPSTPPM